MSRSGDISLSLGGEDRQFRLAIGEWRAVQEALDAGPAELMARLAPPFNALRAGLTYADIVGSGLLGTWRVDDCRVIIHHALIGGGMELNKARGLVAAWVDARPLLEPLPLAYRIVYASLVGAEDEAASGEPQGETETAPPRSPEASSGSGTKGSTRRAARSGSRRGKSTG